MNIMGRLGKPRLSLIKALCSQKYGQRYYTAIEMNGVIAENGLNLYTANGRTVTEKHMQDAMSKAHKKLKQPKEKETGGEHIVTNPFS